MLGGEVLKEDFSTKATTTLTDTWDKIVGITLPGDAECTTSTGTKYKHKSSTADGDTRTATYELAYYKAQLATSGTT